MKFNELITSRSKTARRVGRGNSSGHGKTAGRGTKGQKSRSGKTIRPGFEGGQNPLMQRLPKLRGFNSHKIAPETIYTGQLGEVKGASITNHSLYEVGLLTSPHTRVKLVVKGDVPKKYTVKLQSASKAAIEMIQKAGGSFEAVEQIKRQSKTEKSVD